MRSRRVSVGVILLVSSLLGAGIIAGGCLGESPSSALKPTKTTPTHTLVITSTNGSGSYTVTASNGLHLTKGEQSDYQLRGPRVTGTVGTGDAKDVIRYTGYIESFQAEGSIRVTLDGQRLAPTVLAGQYIQLRRSNTSQSVSYRFAVTGRISRGVLAEQNDTVTDRRVRGHVRDTADAFYFTGTILNDSITLSGPVQIQINGQSASVFLTHAPPTPPAPSTATPSPSPSLSPSPTPTSTVPSPTTPTPTLTHSPPTPTPTSDGGAAPNTSKTSLLDQLAHSVVSLVTGIAAIVAVLYLLFSDR
jgi:hypothetical protein